MGTKARGGITLYNVKNGKDAEYHRLRPQSEKAVVGADNSLYIILSYIIEHVNGAQVTTEAGSAQGYHVTARMNNGVSIAMTNGAVNSGTYKLTDYSKAQNRPDYVIIELRDSADKVVDIRTAQIIMEASSYVDIVADLRTTVSQHGDSISTIKQTANSVSATITSLKNGLETVGMHLDGENSTFDVIADKFKVVTTTGVVSFFTEGGKLNADLIDAKSIVAKGIKAQTIDAKGATFQNITVTGKSKFGGELDGASGTFKVLRCLNSDNEAVGGIYFEDRGSQAIMAMEGDLGMRKYIEGKFRKRLPRFYAKDVWCQGQFGHYAKICAVIKDDIMYVHHGGHIETNGVKVQLPTLTVKSGGRDIVCYKIPLYAPGYHGADGDNGIVLDVDNPALQPGLTDFYREIPFGAPIDMVIFNCETPHSYVFFGMGYGKDWVAFNGNDNVGVYICDHREIRKLDGGWVSRYLYVNPLWLTPTKTKETPGAGVLYTGTVDFDW